MSQSSYQPNLTRDAANFQPLTEVYGAALTEWKHERSALPAEKQALRKARKTSKFLLRAREGAC